MQIVSDKMTRRYFQRFSNSTNREIVVVELISVNGMI